MAYTNIKVELYLSAAWVNVSADVMKRMSVKYGNWEHGPTARVTQTGTFEFALNNTATNSGAVVGYYSPGHASCRTGFKQGVRVRLTFYWGVSTKVKFLGRLADISPVSGSRREGVTRCIAVDWMDEFAKFAPVDIGQLGLATLGDKTAPQLIDGLINLMPADAQPLVPPSYDSGSEYFTYAFNDTGEGTSALSLAQEAVLSDYGWLDMRGDGTLLFRNRHSASIATSSLTLTSANIIDIEAPTSLDDVVFNLVRVTANPMLVSSDIEVLYRQESGPQTLKAGVSYVFWIRYSLPDSDRVLAGLGYPFGPGSLVPYTDYVLNSLPDGSGIDRTSASTVTASWYASHAKITIMPGVDCYLMLLQLRGTAVYSLEHRTLQAGSTQSYGQRLLELDMHYMGDINVAQALADTLLDRYKTASNRVWSVTISPHKNNDALINAVNIETGDILTVSDTVTGIASAKVRVNGIALEIDGKAFEIRRMTFCTEPAFSYDGAAWILNDGTYSVLGTTTSLVAV